MFMDNTVSDLLPRKSDHCHRTTGEPPAEDRAMP